MNRMTNLKPGEAGDTVDRVLFPVDRAGPVELFLGVHHHEQQGPIGRTPRRHRAQFRVIDRAVAGDHRASGGTRQAHTRRVPCTVTVR